MGVSSQVSKTKFPSIPQDSERSTYRSRGGVIFDENSSVVFSQPRRKAVSVPAEKIVDSSHKSTFFHGRNYRMAEQNFQSLSPAEQIGKMLKNGPDPISPFDVRIRYANRFPAISNGDQTELSSNWRRYPARPSSLASNWRLLPSCAPIAEPQRRSWRRWIPSISDTPPPPGASAAAPAAASSSVTTDLSFSAPRPPRRPVPAPSAIRLAEAAVGAASAASGEDLIARSLRAVRDAESESCPPLRKPEGDMDGARCSCSPSSQNSPVVRGCLA
jgi:hypothetical protein